MNNFLLKVIVTLLVVLTVIEAGQLYSLYNFWQMDKRFVESTNMEQSSDKEQTQYAL